MVSAMLDGESLSASSDWLYSSTPYDDGDMTPFGRRIVVQRNFAKTTWQSIDREYDRIASDLAIFETRIVPRSIYVLVSLLVGLLVACLIVPMGYLSASAPLPKTLMLVAFSVLSLSFLGYLVWEIERLKRAVNLGRDFR
jgi:hypothetical protein